VGTFTQLDTVAGSAANPISMNRYLYAEANPTSFIDPSGHSIARTFDSQDMYEIAQYKSAYRKAAATVQCAGGQSGEACEKYKTKVATEAGGAAAAGAAARGERFPTNWDKMDPQERGRTWDKWDKRFRANGSSDVDIQYYACLTGRDAGEPWCWQQRQAQAQHLGEDWGRALAGLGMIYGTAIAVVTAAVGAEYAGAALITAAGTAGSECVETGECQKMAEAAQANGQRAASAIGSNPTTLQTLTSGSYWRDAGGNPVTVLQSRLPGGWSEAVETFERLTGQKVPPGATNVTTTVNGIRYSVRPDSSGGWPTIDVFDPVRATLEKVRFGMP
jgi:hypothetical protein